VRQASARPQLAPANIAPGSHDDADPRADDAAPERAPAPTSYGSLTARELLGLLPSLGPADLQALRDLEAEHGRRASVLRGIDRLLAGHETSAR
jgi:hypothetical protein